MLVNAFDAKLLMGSLLLAFNFFNDGQDILHHFSLK